MQEGLWGGGRGPQVPPFPAAIRAGLRCCMWGCAAVSSALAPAARKLRLRTFSFPQVYSVAAYVEADRAAKELGLRQRGGFFDTDDDYGQAIIDGAFNKALVVGVGGGGPGGTCVPVNTHALSAW